MDITYTQCKQIAANVSPIQSMREVIESMNNQPEWITQPLDIADIQAVNQGGCASGAYMPAVTYYDAVKVMADHGDDVLDYLDDIGSETDIPAGTSWSGIAVHYLSMAVEFWCMQFDDVIREM